MNKIKKFLFFKLLCDVYKMSYDDNNFDCSVINIARYQN